MSGGDARDPRDPPRDPLDPRYAPPAAVVADPVEAAAPERVRRAVRLLWTSMALAVPIAVLEITRNPEYGEGGALFAALVIYALLFGLTALLNIKIQRGRNWARVVTLLFVLLGVYFTLSPVDDARAPGVVEWVLNVVCLALEGVAVYWLFTLPGSAWFGRRD